MHWISCTWLFMFSFLCACLLAVNVGYEVTERIFKQTIPSRPQLAHVPEYAQKVIEQLKLCDPPKGILRPETAARMPMHQLMSLVSASSSSSSSSSRSSSSSSSCSSSTSLAVSSSVLLSGSSLSHLSASGSASSSTPPPLVRLSTRAREEVAEEKEQKTDELKKQAKEMEELKRQLKAMSAKVAQLEETNGVKGSGGMMQMFAIRSSSSSASVVPADARDVAELTTRLNELVQKLASNGTLEPSGHNNHVQSSSSSSSSLHDQPSTAHEALFGDRQQSQAKQ